MDRYKMNNMVLDECPHCFSLDGAHRMITADIGMFYLQCRKCNYKIISTIYAPNQPYSKDWENLYKLWNEKSEKAIDKRKINNLWMNM